MVTTSFISTKCRLVYAMLATCVALSWIGMAGAQVENIEPNPTQPYDIDTDFGYGPSSGGAHLGRGAARPGQPREPNPAETMLRDIEGTNYGRYTGRAIAGYRGAAAAPISGQPENRWRYRFHRGRWWYRLPNGGWSYFDGRRWRLYAER